MKNHHNHLNGIIYRSSLVFSLIIFVYVGCSQSQINGKFKITDIPPLEGKNDYYQGNRSPLLSNPLIKLPIKSIRPKGWLRYQLELMVEGYTGHMDEISKFCKYKGNAWVNPKGDGENGWEEVPYWLRGYVSLGYVLDNKRIIDNAERWIKGVLSSQEKSGYFGPKSNWKSTPTGISNKNSLWPNMIMLYAIRTYYSATKDSKVIPFMLKYFKWMKNIPKEQFLPGSWQKKRGGENLKSIYWLYNRTGKKWLLELAKLNHEKTSNWVNGIPTNHGVNIAEGFREPAQYYQQNHDLHFLTATQHDYDTIMQKYGQVPGGMFGADEHIREDHYGPRQAAETCSIVEFMHSDEILEGITGNPIWADHCENVAFNSLPAAMTPDLKGLHYLTAPNMVQLDSTNKSPSLDNKGILLPYDPTNYRCCQHNSGFGWPYFVEHMWMATRGNGIAAVLYGPSAVEAKVGNGTEIQIKETTNYPFGEVIEFKLSMKNPVKFPLFLRVPGWAREAQVHINGKGMPLRMKAASWISLERKWRNGDIIRLKLLMPIVLTKWKKNNNSVSISRGPLSFSLKIGEYWKKYGGTNKWPAYEVFPTTPWNYGLIVNEDHPDKSVEVVVKKGKIPLQPFTTGNAPVEILIKGKRIPKWKLDPNGLIGSVPVSPVKSDQPTETIYLIPMGCARLRVSSFPTIKN